MYLVYIKEQCLKFIVGVVLMACSLTALLLTLYLKLTDQKPSLSSQPSLEKDKFGQLFFCLTYLHTQKVWTFWN